VDASACGTPNVALTKTAAIDCTGQACTGSITLNKAAFNCSDTVQISLLDADLAGSGSRTVEVVSYGGDDPRDRHAPRIPGGLGDLRRLDRHELQAVAPNGILNVAQGSTMTVRYLDASACGVANTLIQKSSPSTARARPARASSPWTSRSTPARTRCR
jgi:hypothetical protein